MPAGAHARDLLGVEEVLLHHEVARLLVAILGDLVLHLEGPYHLDENRRQHGGRLRNELKVLLRMVVKGAGADGIGTRSAVGMTDAVGVGVGRGGWGVGVGAWELGLEWEERKVRSGRCGVVGAEW